MKKFLSLLTLCLLTGCANYGLRDLPEVTRAVSPLRHVPDQQAKLRIAELRGVLAGLKDRGTVVITRSFYRVVTPEALVERIRAYGFNRIYCRLYGAAEFLGEEGEALAGLLKAAAQSKIAVEFLILQRDLPPRESRSPVERLVLPEYPTLPGLAKKMQEFCEKLPKNCRPAGITWIVEPHLFNGSDIDLTFGSLYCWSPDTFGPGLDNDLMLEFSFSIFRQTGKFVPVTLGMHDFYHNYGLEGKLTHSKITDFLVLSPRIVVASTANKPSELVSHIIPLLKTAPADSVTVGIFVADHTSVTEGALRRRNWDDLVRSLRYALARYRECPAFRGVVLGPFRQLEFMREELD